MMVVSKGHLDLCDGSINAEFRATYAAFKTTPSALGGRRRERLLQLQPCSMFMDFSMRHYKTDSANIIKERVKTEEKLE